MTSAAYLLFYRRRTDHPLGGPVIEQMLAQVTEADSEAPAGSRDVSPMAGEGRRLGDSSHNGSSSAYQAGRVHLVGDGGSEHLSPNQDRLQGTQAGSLQKSIETTQQCHDEDLPAYSVEYELSGGQMQTMPKDSLSPPTPDEAVDMDYDDAATYHQQWGVVNEQSWSFNQLPNQSAQPPNSVDDMLADNRSVGSNDSTRVEGNAGSDIDEGYQDTPMFSDTPQDDTQMRSMRESAPPPTEFVPVKVSQEDDDDDLPVHEIPAPE